MSSSWSGEPQIANKQATNDTKQNTEQKTHAKRKFSVFAQLEVRKTTTEVKSGFGSSTCRHGSLVESTDPISSECINCGGWCDCQCYVCEGCYLGEDAPFTDISGPRESKSRRTRGKTCAFDSTLGFPGEGPPKVDVSTSSSSSGPSHVDAKGSGKTYAQLVKDTPAGELRFKDKKSSGPAGAGSANIANMAHYELQSRQLEVKVDEHKGTFVLSEEECKYLSGIAGRPVKTGRRPHRTAALQELSLITGRSLGRGIGKLNLVTPVVPCELVTYDDRLSTVSFHTNPHAAPVTVNQATDAQRRFSEIHFGCVLVKDLGEEPTPLIRASEDYTTAERTKIMDDLEYRCFKLAFELYDTKSFNSMSDERVIRRRLIKLANAVAITKETHSMVLWTKDMLHRTWREGRQLAFEARKDRLLDRTFYDVSFADMTIWALVNGTYDIGHSSYNAYRRCNIAGIEIMEALGARHALLRPGSRTWAARLTVMFLMCFVLPFFEECVRAWMPVLKADTSGCYHEANMSESYIFRPCVPNKAALGGFEKCLSFAAGWEIFWWMQAASLAMGFFEFFRSGRTNVGACKVLGHLVLCYMHVTYGFWTTFGMHMAWNVWSIALGHGELTLALLSLPDVHTGDNFGAVISDVCTADHNLPLKQARSDFKMRCEPVEPCCVDDRGFGAAFFWGSMRWCASVFRACRDCILVALFNRAAKDIPATKTKEARKAVTDYWNSIDVSPIANMIARVRRPIPFLDWVKTFLPGRRMALTRIWELHEDYDVRRIVANSFGKREIAMKDTDASPDGDSFKDPRLIQGCPLELSVILGPWLRRLAKNTRQGLRPKGWDADDLAKGRQILYTCGLSSDAIGHAFKKAIDGVENMMEPGDEVVFIEDDQSRFDMHILEGAFNAVLRIYQKVLPKKLLKYLRRRVSKGITSCGIFYELLHTMQSGWPDTSLTDTLVNAIMKFEAHGRGLLWFSIVCGDDSVTVTTRKTLKLMGGVSKLIEVYTAFGMETTIEVRNMALDVGFCSGRFMPVMRNGAESFVLLPKPGKILGKIGWDMTKRADSARVEWLKGIATTLEMYGRYDPLYAAAAKPFRAAGTGIGAQDRNWEYKAAPDHTSAPTHDQLLEYYDHHYNWSAQDHADLCITLSRSALGTPIDSSLFDELLSADL